MTRDTIQLSLREKISFWCPVDSYEIDVIAASASEKLMRDICVNGGWCGGIVNGKFTTVDSLLPSSGNITADEFAILTVRADGWPDNTPIPDKHLHYLAAKFIKHLGASTVDASVLHAQSRLPFDTSAD
ncbi:hypothetical protein HFP51_00950 [Parasphingopyxis sp. CP4]|uniref:hypothetical protein n=1 Tax=Parasphingopyxis sp. CP4 TaxID=2724527 RepID=UPI0015A022A5|nr:hypothetical protein [Parasphingopyxis sp. CP4]QLC20874.1 hypothetical protein HFP51_00950 [Parasphingopyxis sp. CP4]